MGSPIKLFVKAQERYLRGDKEKAADLLGKAIGIGKGTPQISSFLDVVFEKDCLLSDMVLHTVAYEENKRWRRSQNG